MMFLVLLDQGIWKSNLKRKQTLKVCKFGVAHKIEINQKIVESRDLSPRVKRHVGIVIRRDILEKNVQRGKIIKMDS